MKVIGAGLGGTGTIQVAAALEVLGFGPCYHIAEAQQHPEQLATWAAAADAGKVDWETLFAGYASCIDFPAYVAYREMLIAHPEAKVLLTVRDPARAYARLRQTIYALCIRPDSPLPVPLRRVFDRFVWEGIFGGAFEDRTAAVEVYRRWPDEVKAHVAPDRLLVYDVEEGWEPLCHFLGCDVPTAPFPGGER